MRVSKYFGVGQQNLCLTHSTGGLGIPGKVGAAIGSLGICRGGREGSPTASHF